MCSEHKLRNMFHFKASRWRVDGVLASKIVFLNVRRPFECKPQELSEMRDKVYMKVHIFQI